MQQVMRCHLIMNININMPVRVHAAAAALGNAMSSNNEHTHKHTHTHKHASTCACSSSISVVMQCHLGWRTFFFALKRNKNQLCLPGATWGYGYYHYSHRDTAIHTYVHTHLTCSKQKRRVCVEKRFETVCVHKHIMMKIMWTSR